MSSHTSKWILLVLLPSLLALYLSYPPVSTDVARYRIERKQAQTQAEAQAHDVSVGEYYVVEQEKTWGRWLPLAMGAREERSRLVEELADGTLVEERTVTVPGHIKLGLDVAGGTELLYQLEPGKGETIGGSLSNTISILKKRIDPSNVKEFRIQALENDRILIQVPQASTAEVEQLKRRLEKMGRLEFKLAAPREGQHLRLYEQADAGQVPEGYERMYLNGEPDQGYQLVKQGESEITGRYLSRVYETVDEFGLPAVGFEFNAIGARQFAQVTEANRGWNLAIILDGVLKSAPVIRERIGGRGIISGQFSRAEVQDMVNILQAGSLPMDIRLLQESTVGPQLGRDSIRKGLLALAVAGVLVLAFIGIYYVACGLVADGALLLNLLFLVGVLSFLGAALTLPGMAGILLTVGMAVDANVLIFERIREESGAGKPVRVALRNGYERAFSTIVDANVTTLLTAIILYIVGTGPVKGFAITLSFGILLSMFTALMVTRLAFETIIDKGWLKEFRMRALVQDTSIGFSAIRKPAYLMSAGVLVVGLVAFIGRGSQLYDIDFTGGSLVQLSLAEAVPVSRVRDMLADVGYPDAEVQGIRGAGATEEGLTDFAIRVKGGGMGRMEEGLLPNLTARLSSAGLALDQELKATTDGMAVEAVFTDPAEEGEIRRALATEDGGRFSLDQIGVIVSEEDVSATEFAVHAFQVSPLVGDRELWGIMLQTLSLAELQARDYTVEQVQWVEKGEDGRQLRLALDGAVQPEMLQVEFDRRDFPALTAEAVGEDGAGFLLSGPQAALEEFEQVFPIGAEFMSVPTARIDGRTVTATLREPFPEKDIRSLFDKQGLPNVYIVPLGATGTSYRLELSYEPIRQKMEQVFAGLAHSNVQVTFESVQSEGDASGDGRVRVTMKVDEPMTIDVIRNYIENADLGPYAQGIIVNDQDYPADLQVSQVELALQADRASEMQSMIGRSFGEPRPIQRVVSIGSTVAEEMQGRALLAVVFASVIIVLYVAARFHAFRFGVAAVIALVHDIVITAGLIALADWSGVMGDVKINLPMLAAFLTILGYSLNDTIVVFDRIRENMGKLGRNRVNADLIDLSINQTLSRTILTSVTTLAVVVVLYLLGGSVLQGLALTLIIGVVIGTYSSMFIASPVLLDWNVIAAGAGRVFRVATLPVRLPFRGLAKLLGS